MRYFAKPNAIRFKQNAIFCETQPNSLQGKCSVLRNPTHFSSRKMLCFAKPIAFLFQEYALFCETQRISLQGQRLCFEKPNSTFLKIPFKKLQISEDADISQKNPGAYGAFQKLPQPENPTHFSTYYGQKMKSF